ncbi:DUF5954 family protein, partial [Streptomyces cacaoi]|uniref:DUF5954 family protein n=1 Tax=Streptomyces cacaoi TaxID=1898 RepID=UPI001F3237B8
TGRHMRIVRVERFIRIGPDGPEGPRPPDPDPDPPILVQDQQLRETGELPPDNENTEPDLPPDITARHKELFRLSIQEKERQEKLTQTRQQRQN